MNCERTVQRGISTQPPSVTMTFAESLVLLRVHTAAKETFRNIYMINILCEKIIQHELLLINSNV